MIKAWQILRSCTVFDHHWYTLRQDTVQLPDGQILDDYFVSVRHDVVLVLAVTPDGNVPVVRQYKHGARRILCELPGGYINNGEAPEQAARRELLEETGYTAEKFELLARVYGDPTKDTNVFYPYLARSAINVQEQSLDHTEAIEVELVPVKQLRHRVLHGEFEVAGSITAIYLALERLEQY